MSEKQYIAFNLNQVEFGIDIMDVREILPYEESIVIPNTPDFIEGIINNRGNIIPIVNLKKRLSIGELEITKDSRIIVITLDDMDIGFIVDEVSQTIMLDSSEIEAPPSIIGGVEKKYLTGIGKLEDGRLLILVDLIKILSQNEIEEIHKIEG